MNGSFVSVILMLLHWLVFSLSSLLLLRFAMQLLRISFNNQGGHFVLQLTNWLVIPLRRVIPGFLGLDFSSLIPAFLLHVLEVAVLLYMLNAPANPDFLPLLPLFFWLGFIGLLRTCLQLIVALLFLQAILSWINPYSPLSAPLQLLTDPFLRPLRRVIPLIANIDLSPLVAILIAQVLLTVLR